MKFAFSLAFILALAACSPIAYRPVDSSTTARLAFAKKATAAVSNPRSLAIDISGNLYIGDTATSSVIKITPAGTVSTLSEASDPLGLAAGSAGSVYVACASSGEAFCVMPDGKSRALISWGAELHTPTGVAVDASGNAYITNNGDCTILKVTPQGQASVFAGESGTNGFADGAGPAARFATPRGICIDAQGNLYVADEGNSNIRKITPQGVVSTLAGDASNQGSADGRGSAARFAAPRSLAATPDGTVYVADTDNHTIRKITPKGDVTTLAGKAGESGYADGSGPSARFSEPRGIAVDPAGNVFVADTGNGAIRRIAPSGEVTTVVTSPQ